MCTDPWWHGPVCDGSCAESPHGTRESGVSAPVESNACAVESHTSEAARCGNTETAPNPQLDLDERQASVSVSADVDHRQAALDLLAIHSAAMDKERRARTYFITLARQYGITNREIGEVLGMTEAGVRMYLQRALGERP